MQAAPIGPKLPPDWPVGQSTPQYWLARKTFHLPAEPSAVIFKITADRHYEVFINGRRAGRQRGFFSGDQYLFAQEWTSELLPFLTAGDNQIEFVIRSDPWQNKNYRCFKPLLMVEGEIRCGGQKILLCSDASWQAGVIENWRRQIALGGCGTIPYEEINVPTTGRGCLSGFDKNIRLFPVQVYKNKLPTIYLWNDFPKRIKTFLPRSIPAAGQCRLIDQALVFDAPSPGEETRTFQADFKISRRTEMGLAVSALVPSKVELDGEIVFEHQNVPDRHQMSLPDYLIPAGIFNLSSGNHSLRINLFKPPQGWREFRLSADGVPPMRAPSSWSCPFKSVPLELTERLGAKISLPDPGLAEQRNDPFSLRVQAGKGLFFAVIDFGALVSGRPRLKVSAQTPGQIYLAYGYTFRNGVVDCHRMGLRMADKLKILAGESLYESFDVRTFRYLDLIFEGFEGKVDITDFAVEELEFFDEEKLMFATSDEQINAIFHSADRTFQICFKELVVDNPEREHAQWSDPTMTCCAAGYYAGGPRISEKARKVYEEFFLSQQADGQLAGYAPGKWFPRLPLQCHMALLFLGCYEHFLQTGDNNFARQTLDVYSRVIEHWERYRTYRGLLADLHTVFVDWGSQIYSYGRGSKGPTGALTAMNGYYLGVLENASSMARWLGKDADAKHYARVADEIRRAMWTELYDLKVGAFRDGKGEPLAEKNISQPANALAVLFGAAPKEKGAEILRRVFDEQNRLYTIPANALFALVAAKALFETGNDALAFSWLRNGYGKMLAGGTGTLWETWEPHASLSQGTGAAPVYLFARYLAGLFPMEPGYHIIGIDPHPCSLTRLQAVFFLPHGEVHIHWEKTDHGLDYHLQLPRALKNCRLQKPDDVQAEITFE